MDASTVSNMSEGIYIGLVSPDQDVYSTVDQTSHNSPGAQHTERSGQRSRPYSLAVVCVGLCALLLTPAIVLGVLYMSASQNYSMRCGGMEEFRANISTLNKNKDQLQRDNDSLNTQKDQVQRDYNSLNTQKDQLQRDYNSLNTQNIQLQRDYNSLNKDKDQLQRDYDAVVVKFPILDQYCPLRSQKRVCKPCPEGWEQRNSKCYYFSTVKKSWNDSRSDCLKQGADLVIIESKEEQDFISKHRREDDGYWIGLSDSETEGTWLWVDGTPLQKDKAFWESGQPNDYRGSQDCAVIHLKNEWNDFRCPEPLRSVCKTDALPL
ncbi:hypothetical protein AAFF_G00067550 [Aldrovandia affinis]|uniref:C-type lectin domain-containing protein n=1 Tax=Aldrovandia affinis TaxID=143900 RepID=A0AAD7WDJ4_9TELE|nr:hypothetical protein AAFF_G00067550 [Aldrovandia affinis]